MTDNNLKTYLEDQMKEYREESESLKALYGDILEHIEECKLQIKSLKSKEDTGFALLSPISVDSTYQQQIDRIKDQMEAFEKQKDKYKNDIRFYDKKIQEISDQLEEFEKQVQSLPETPASEEAPSPRPQEPIMEQAQFVGLQEMQPQEIQPNLTKTDNLQTHVERGAVNSGISYMKVTDANIIGTERKNKSGEDPEGKNLLDHKEIESVLQKLSDIKGLVQMDPIRCRLEIDRLEKFLENMLKK